MLKFFYYSVHLVELKGTGQLYAMKAMDKSIMMNRNKVWFSYNRTKKKNILCSLKSGIFFYNLHIYAGS